ncbi:MAG: hypothetical protein V2A79_00180 [Planctomycetota bacterium]
MNQERPREIAIRIVDEFEELLAEKGIMIPSADREGGEEEACLYGTEYYLLEDAVVGILMKEFGEGRPDDGAGWRKPTEGIAGKASFPPARRGWR